MAYLDKLKKHKTAIFILIVAFTLRLWNIDTLTTFSGDQGYDFLIVKKILEGDLILLGPKIGPYNEIGNLYLGPAYYYLIAPFLLIFNLDPIGPAIETAILAVLTVFLIYQTGIRFFSKKVGVLSSGFYATNAFLIDQSRAASNPHLIPFFASIFLFSSLMQIKKNSNIIWSVISGISLGIIFQLHYLGVSLLVPLAIMLIYKLAIKKLIVVIASFIITLSGQILFEITHNFFVTKIFLKQISSGKSLTGPNAFLDNLSYSLSQLSQIIIQDKILPIATFLVLFVLIWINLNKYKKNQPAVFILGISCISAIFLTSVYSGKIEPHYFASIYPSILILLAIAITSLANFSKNITFKILAVLLSLCVFLVNIWNINLFRESGYTMPQGLNLKIIRNASKIISIDSKNSLSFNIASTLDGDTRAQPYRYLVEVYGAKPQDVENYPTSGTIYLISRDEEKLIYSYTVWEISSFKPFKIVSSWNLGNGITLYKLEKNSSHT